MRVRVKPEREQNVSPISIHSFRILHVVLFFFECKISVFFSNFSNFFFNLAVEEHLRHFEEIKFLTFTHQDLRRRILLFFQRRRFRLLVFFNGKRERESVCVCIRWCAAFVLSALVFV